MDVSKLHYWIDKQPEQMPVFWCKCYQHKLIKLHILAYLWILVIYDIHNTFSSIKLENYSSSVTVWSRSNHLRKSHLSVNVSPAKHLEITLSICVMHFEGVASSQSLELSCLIKAIMHCLITTYIHI